MPSPPSLRRITCAAWLLMAFAGAARATVVPANFVVENVTPGAAFDLPTGIAFLPDGRMLVAEKRGRVYVVENGVKRPTPLWEGEREVLNAGDRGLLGVVVDPAFPVNRRIYLLFTVDPDSNGVDDNDDAFGRLVRYQVSASDSNVVDPGTRTVLLGATWPTGPASGSTTHTIGSLRWGADGTLLVSAGEGAQFSSVDAGGLDPGLFLPGRTDPSEDIGAYRAQYLGSLAGKILRIDPETGRGLPSNPFWDGNPDSPRSKVWAYGLRNPYRFTVKPGTGSGDPAAGNPGTLYIGDVGWKTWEEISVARSPGRNFGWPCREGFASNDEYLAGPQPPHHGCGTIGTPENPSPASPPILVTHHTDPALSQPPGAKGNTVIGGTFYSGTNYPEAYRGALFFADYGQKMIRVLRVSPADSLLEVLYFASDITDGPVDVSAHPLTGDIHYTGILTGTIYRVRYTGGTGNTPPVAVATATPDFGLAPLEVWFSSAGSGDPDWDPITFAWTFGDGTGSTLADPVHTYGAPGTYAAILNVSDGKGGVGVDTAIVVVTVAGGFPSTAVLDRFGRGDGPLGGSWLTSAPNLVIVDSSATQSSSASAAAIWPTVFGAAQEAHWLLRGTSSSAAAQNLLLKVQGTDSTDAHLEVRYRAARQELTIETFGPGGAREIVAGPFSVRLRAGDHLGARAHANGNVEVFRNGSVILEGTAAGWPWATAGGRIGFLLARAGGGRHDDFGGGDANLLDNTPPQAQVLSPPDGMFYVSGDSIRLAAAGTDAESAPAALAWRWDVLLHHNNHVHPLLSVDSSHAVYVAEDHDDGTGVRIENRVVVTDPGGLADTASVTGFPEVDLRPSSLATNPTTPGTTTSAVYRFTLHNDGRMPAPLSRWRLVADSAVLAEGDTVVAALDSVAIAVTLPPVLAAGTHTLRAVADTLGGIVETDETDNAVARALVVVQGSDPYPPIITSGPTAEASSDFALVRWTTDEGTTGTVRWGLTRAWSDSVASPFGTSHEVRLDGLAVGFTYQFEVTARDPAGNTTTSAPDSFTTRTGPLAAGDPAPRRLALSAAHPNPASGAVRFALELPSGAAVGMTIHDVAGRGVWSTGPRSLAAGRWSLEWPGSDWSGRAVGPGLYLARVTVGSEAFTRRMVILR